MTMTMTDTADRRAGAEDLFRRKSRVALAVPAVILAYFVYVFFAFDVPGLAERARMDNARVLVADSYSYKVHVTRDNRSGAISYAMEGENKGKWPEGERPDWVSGGEASELVIDLEDGYVVRFLPDNAATFDVPGFGRIEMQVNGREIVTNLGDDVPEWINASDSRIAITTDAGRMSMTRNRTEVFRYFFGWEQFWFTLDSPYHGKSAFQILFGPQLDTERSNWGGAAEDFWTNAMWRHADVFWAMGETILMAFLGTFGAAIVALPLAFLAAKNFARFGAVRFAVRRVFDFVRGVDGLIWTIILSRAFGPGPLTGALAILITDTGSFGKSFSEALEMSTTSRSKACSRPARSPVQRYRFGVIPQVTPVLLSQILYYFESNTRSATIIGAITGGGIGLFLTQAIQTQKDWEEVTYYIVLIVVMVMVMDWISGILRRRLITGTDAGH
jgi:phosphonate transport system permease protein